MRSDPMIQVRPEVNATIATRIPIAQPMTVLNPVRVEVTVPSSAVCTVPPNTVSAS